MASELKSTTVDKVHKELLGQVSDTYQKTEGFPTWDILKAAAFGIKRVWDKVFMIDYLQDVDNLTGTDLERFIYQRKGLKRKEATHAVGFVNIVRGEGVVREGDVFSTSGGVEFTATETKAVKEGDKVAVQAINAGLVGNVAAETIVEMPVTIQGIAKITNDAPSADGYDSEDDDSLRDRYYEALREPATSGNVAHYRRWAREVEGVGDCKVFALWKGDNTVQVVIVDDNGLSPTAETVKRCQDYIDPDSAGTGMGEAPIGAHCTVNAATVLNIDVSATIVLDNNVELENIKASASAAIKKYLASVALNAEYVSMAKLGNIIISTEGVADYHSLKINGNADRVPVPAKSVAVLRSVTLNV